MPGVSPPFPSAPSGDRARTASAPSRSGRPPFRATATSEASNGEDDARRALTELLSATGAAADADALRVASLGGSDASGRRVASAVRGARKVTLLLWPDGAFQVSSEYLPAGYKPESPVPFSAAQVADGLALHSAWWEQPGTTGGPRITGTIETTGTITQRGVEVGITLQDERGIAVGTLSDRITVLDPGVI